MEKFTLFTLLLICSLVFSQNRTEDFQVILPETKVANSLYKTIKLIDARTDSTNLGIVQKGVFNAKARVVPTVPLAKQIQSVLDATNGANAENGEMVLYLKQLSFAEITGMVSEKGYCYFQAFLFGKNADDSYSPLDKIDEVIVHSSMDVTKATMKKGSELISQFIAKNVNKKGDASVNYTFEGLKKFDQIEKNKYPLYANDELKNGLYSTFENFRNQTPNEEIYSSVKFGSDSKKIIKIYSDKNGKEKEMPKENYFALVDKGTAYIFSDLDNSFIPMERRENDFYYIAKAKTNAKTGNVVLASAFFGIIGGLIASDASANFEMKLDYLNGGPIPIKEVKK